MFLICFCRESKDDSEEGRCSGKIGSRFLFFFLHAKMTRNHLPEDKGWAKNPNNPTMPETDSQLTASKPGAQAHGAPFPACGNTALTITVDKLQDYSYWFLMWRGLTIQSFYHHTGGSHINVYARISSDIGQRPRPSSQTNWMVPVPSGPNRTGTKQRCFALGGDSWFGKPPPRVIILYWDDCQLEREKKLKLFKSDPGEHGS